MSLDPESLLGIKSEVLKAAVSASLLGVLWHRQFKLAEALSSIAAGLGSAIWIASVGGRRDPWFILDALLVFVPADHPYKIIAPWEV